MLCEGREGGTCVGLEKKGRVPRARVGRVVSCSSC